MNTNWLKFFMAFATIALIASCVKEDFKDPPPEGADPDIQTNSTIADVKAFYQAGNYVQITEDLIFSAIVVADDRSGNFFRNLVIQDETGGIQLRFNFTDLYNDYPIGRRLFIRAKDMYISDFNGSLQLGAGVVRDAAGNPTEMEGIPLPLANRFIVKGKWNEDRSPASKRVDELTESDINTLIKLENVQFRASDLGETFAINTVDDDGNQVRITVNRDLTSCTGDAPIIVRTSGFADFANTPLPHGSGTITGIYTVFGATKQLFIREIEDVQLNEDRCDFAFTPISSIRGQFAGSTTNVSGAAIIKGIVISDKDNLNIVGQNLFIQDETAGIAVRFTGNHNFAVGTELEIDVSGVQLNQFQGLLQLNNVDLLNAQQISTGNEVQPIQLTISNLLGNFNQYESRLVVIRDVEISKADGGSTFVFTTTLNDGTGQVDLFTRPQATFADTPFPIEPVSVTGIVSVGGNQQARQISMRNLDDIDGDIPQPTTLLEENFQMATVGQDVNLSGWTNYAETGNRLWTIGEFSGNRFATVSAFQSPDAGNKMWLITPDLEIESGIKLEFESAQGFYVHNGLKVYISNDFDGGNPLEATWNELNATIAGPNQERWEFISSGILDLSSFAGTAHIAFVYEGSNPAGNTTTYRIDNLRVFK